MIILSTNISRLTSIFSSKIASNFPPVTSSEHASQPQQRQQYLPPSPLPRYRPPSRTKNDSRSATSCSQAIRHFAANIGLGWGQYHKSFCSIDLIQIKLSFHSDMNMCVHSMHESLSPHNSQKRNIRSFRYGIEAGYLRRKTRVQKQPNMERRVFPLHVVGLLMVTQATDEDETTTITKGNFIMRKTNLKSRRGSPCTRESCPASISQSSQCSSPRRWCCHRRAAQKRCRGAGSRPRTGPRGQTARRS